MEKVKVKMFITPGDTEMILFLPGVPREGEYIGIRDSDPSNDDDPSTPDQRYRVTSVEWNTGTDCPQVEVISA